MEVNMQLFSERFHEYLRKDSDSIRDWITTPKNLFFPHLIMLILSGITYFVLGRLAAEGLNAYDMLVWSPANTASFDQSVVSFLGYGFIAVGFVIWVIYAIYVFLFTLYTDTNPKSVKRHISAQTNKSNISKCHHCSSVNLAKNGRQNGIQRYRCKDCKKYTYGEKDR
jgi:hypothetical protein